MASEPRGVSRGVSRRMKIVIVAMLMIILLPTPILSSPTAKIVIVVKNTDTESSVTVSVRLNEGNYGYQQLVLQPQEEIKSSYSVAPGTHDLQIHYWYEGNMSYYYEHSVSRTYTLWPFETEEDRINLAPPFVT
jgi:hypothetical protein